MPDGGERGIRTLAPHFRDSCLAGKRFRPLSHLSTNLGELVISKKKIYSYINVETSFTQVDFMKITIKVVPKSREPKIILDKTGTLKLYVKSPPEDGKANKELIKLLAEKLKTTQRDITIVSGLTSRTKVLDIAGFTDEAQLFKALGFQVQSSFL